MRKYSEKALYAFMVCALGVTNFKRERQIGAS